jgi:signal peptidase I
MSGNEWLIFFLVIQVIHGLATWKLYIKAGRQAWEAFVPVYNAVILMKIINREWWWTILLFLPIVNLILFPVVWIETARSYGRNSNLDTLLAVFSLGFFNFYLNYVADVEYIENRDLKPRTGLGDWVSSIAFAVVAATIVHTYFIQPFVIPSSSLEKSLLIGDFLFVSKFHYGARFPMTTVALPMVHDSIPLTKQKSYLFSDDYEARKSSWLNKLQLPYMRLPAFEKIDRNEIVVFNQPADTLLDMNVFTPDRNYYKPIDKKTNLVKRCVGTPGDSLQIKDGYVYINGKKNELPDRGKLQFYHTVETTSNAQALYTKYGITETQERQIFAIENRFWDNPQLQTYLKTEGIILNIESRDSLSTLVTGGMTQKLFNRLKVKVAGSSLNVNMTEEIADEMRKESSVSSVIRLNSKVPDFSLFPQDRSFRNSIDNFGPLYIPKKDATVDLNIDVLPLYKRIITEYEGNTLSVNGNQIKINNEVVTSYTFRQDYYWMMGDNRQRSADSRYWGFVPHNHVVGKPVLIWMSWDTNGSGFNKIRWNRLFTTVHGSGSPVSYFIPFLVVLAGFIGFNKWRKRKQAA